MRYHFQKREKVALFLSLCLFILSIVLVGLGSGASVSSVVLGFIPTFLYVVVNFLYIEFSHNKDVFVFSLPLLLVGVFALISLFFQQNVDVISLSFMNLVFSYAFSVLFYKIDSHKLKILHQGHQSQKPSFVDTMHQMYKRQL